MDEGIQIRLECLRLASGIIGESTGQHAVSTAATLEAFLLGSGKKEAPIVETNMFNQHIDHPVGEVTEAELIARSEKPRVTYENLQANIVKETFYQHELLTICVLDLKNGFTVTGQSACAHPENFKLDVGQRLARKDAENEIWALMGYELKTKVRMLEEASPRSYPSQKTYFGTKVIHAEPLNKEAYCTLRGWKVPDNEDPNEEGYVVEYADWGTPNLSGYFGYVSWSPKEVFEKAYQEI